MSKEVGVYCLKNKKNNKKYIGSSKHITERLLEHLNQLEKHVHSNAGLQEAFDKDGLEFCIVEYVEDNTNKGVLLECEQKWIEYYNSTNPKYGYNKINSVSELGVYKPYTKSNIKLRKSKWFQVIDLVFRSNKKIRPLWNFIKIFIK